MTVQHDDQLIRAFLQEGRTDLPERAYVVVRAQIERTRQRPALGWWPDVRRETALRVAIAAVLLAVVAAGFRLIQGPLFSGPGNSPEPTLAPPPVLLPPDTGPITPGTYFTNPVDPVVPIPITFTVPDGWSNAGWALAKNGNYVSFWTVSNTYTDPCRWSTTALDPPLGPTVDDLVAALRNQAGSNTTAPTAVTLGGQRGQRIELDWPADVNSDSCDQREYRIWVFGEDASRGNTMGVHATIWILDVEGLRVVIEADSQPNTPAEQLAEVLSIVNSISFDVPTGGVSVGSCTLGLSELIELPGGDPFNVQAQPISAPYSVAMRPVTDRPPAAQIQADGSGWGEDGPGRPVVSLRQPDGVVVFPGVSTGGGELTTSYALDVPGSWVLSIRAESVGCAQVVPIEVAVEPSAPPSAAPPG